MKIDDSFFFSHRLPFSFRAVSGLALMFDRIRPCDQSENSSDKEVKDYTHTHTQTGNLN